jgi:hypothetical protein
MRASRRRLGAILVTLMLAAPAAAQAATPQAQAAPPCRSTQLVTFITSSEGAAGTNYVQLTFANLGSACSLRGFPGVSAVALDGRSLGAASRVTGVAKVRTVTLAAERPGSFSEAQATLGIVDTGALPNCAPVNAVALKVYAPNTTVAKMVPLPFPACKGRSVLSIRPVTKN